MYVAEILISGCCSSLFLCCCCVFLIVLVLLFPSIVHNPLCLSFSFSSGLSIPPNPSLRCSPSECSLLVVVSSNRQRSISRLVCVACVYSDFVRSHSTSCPVLDEYRQPDLLDVPPGAGGWWVDAWLSQLRISSVLDVLVLRLPSIWDNYLINTEEGVKEVNKKRIDV